MHTSCLLDTGPLHAAPRRAVQAGFTACAMAHPDTYLHKVLLGSAEGQLLLLNFNTGAQLYTFKGW